MKRSRIAGSPSLADVLMRAGEEGSSSHIWEAKRARPATVTCCETVCSAVESPPPPPSNMTSSSRFGFLKFLDECSWCRKWIPPMTDVFMYRGCAYCTENCREWQYEKDVKEGGISPVRTTQLQIMEISVMKNAMTTTPLK